MIEKNKIVNLNIWIKNNTELDINIFELKKFEIGQSNPNYLMKTDNIKFYLISRSNPKIPESSRWKLKIENIVDQQPALVFCSYASLEDFPQVTPTTKYQFLKTAKPQYNPFLL